MKRLLTATLTFIGIVFLISCASSPSLPTGITPNSVSGKIAQEPTLKTLTQALRDAKLLELLNDDNAEYTVFAPSDTAFAASGTLPSGDALERLLYYHVINGSLDEATLKAGGSQDLETVAGRILSVTLVDGALLLNGQARITRADVKASNGVIHVIDKVLTPPNDN
jgi:uncharacterized surface protein with fasciclin (FAS1) repeats